MYKIIQKRKIWISISVVLFVTAIYFISAWGLKLGIDFTGGSLLEIKFGANKPNVIEVSEAIKDLKLNSLSVQPSENSFILRFQDNSEEVHQSVLTSLRKLNDSKNPVKLEQEGTSTAAVTANNSFEELNFTAIGPSIGQELQKKAVYSIILVLIAISLYISYAFRKVSKPIASWKYGVATLIALFHDTIIVIGFFALLGKFWGIEVNTSFVAAVLTVLGFSVHDTIVVFDRIRENLPKSADDFENTINKSVNQTLTRSINTSMTVMFVLFSIVLFGGASIKYFALALFVGIFFGTYSSIFLASPLLVVWNNLKRKAQ
ncbi:protein translocase subunit SecF [Candidatus Falkowbacteria bacterium CG_4_10_14_0_2_um_filter_41_15]|uniref:Protein-export membrane protein SecF n=3 Tax=Candidatus Falkowiibacteriota TaxID=1752728 RepID=A0A2G9ZND3_9BACT|nr:MAG: protein translocase subunit SecF [Candidatus Falkowbacteria bacterium CG23_combo_of_CG06-09_8_20_14_all_41_10]PIZ10753.1 MAG: protein translocase subunit SecF [Candidatus Falkowbacteria bacterium CG_4_10_14_0_8_um_filter_41_36]PJA09942.1 MAG: protein translocase subunit SecF [Candidatus Falkowbacteria bacterium CG_4_10_14_0_2_um_filter_41_15]